MGILIGIIVGALVVGCVGAGGALWVYHRKNPEPEFHEDDADFEYTLMEEHMSQENISL